MVHSVMSFLRSFLVRSPLISSIRSTSCATCRSYTSCRQWSVLLRHLTPAALACNKTTQPCTCKRQRQHRSRADLERVLVALLQLGEGSVDLAREEGARHDHRVLHAVLQQPLCARPLLIRRQRRLELRGQRGAHRVHHVLQPHLHGAVAAALPGKCHVLALACSAARTCFHLLS